MEIKLSKEWLELLSLYEDEIVMNSDLNDTTVINDYCTRSRDQILEKPELARVDINFLAFPLLGQLNFVDQHKWSNWFQDESLPSFEEVVALTEVKKKTKKEITEILSLFLNLDEKAAIAAIMLNYLLQHKQDITSQDKVVSNGDVYMNI